MSNKYSYIKIALVLSFFLVIPFTIKTLNAKLEIYPAPIFPSGSSKFQVEAKPEIYYNVLYGIDSISKEKKKLDKYKFFKKIPMHYLNLLSNKNFGLDNEKQVKSIIFLGYELRKQNKVLPTEVEESKKWVRKLLTEQGCLDATLIIGRNRIFIQKDTKKIYNLTVLDEETISLN